MDSAKIWFFNTRIQYWSYYDMYIQTNGCFLKGFLDEHISYSIFRLAPFQYGVLVCDLWAVCLVVGALMEPAGRDVLGSELGWGCLVDDPLEFCCHGFGFGRG